MSNKYKNFTKGVAEGYGELPAGVKRVGYLRKLKKLKKRFFVLYSECDNAQARLEYFSSEKKWRSGGEPRRSIELKSCFNISRKLHSKQKFVIALYTEDDCFPIVTETAEELEQWLNDMLEEHHSTVDEDSKGKPIYEHVWQVNIDDNDLEFSRNITGPYRIALSSQSLTLIKMSPSTEKVDVLEFPLMSIRRCGHSGKHFFIELGRSAVTGAGGMWMDTEATIVAQNMHETVLGAMKSSRSKEEAGTTPRPRSASTSENSKPVPARRPVGIVTPHTSLSTNSILSNSRERCDSLPTRPQSINGNFNGPFISALSSPYSSNEPTYQRLHSRPHSMYEWPSFNSPCAKNLSFSPGSLSNATASNRTSYEDVAMEHPYFHAISYPPTASNETKSKRQISEVPDEYLTMSPSEEIKPVRVDYMSMNPTSRNADVKVHDSSVNRIDAEKENVKPVIDYMDMCPTSINTAPAKVRPDGYITMAPGGISEDVPVLIQDGYLDMSPISESLPKFIQNDDDYFITGNINDSHHEQNAESNEVDELVIDKVPALMTATNKGRNLNQKETLPHAKAFHPIQQLENSERDTFSRVESLHHERKVMTDKNASILNNGIANENLSRGSASKIGSFASIPCRQSQAKFCGNTSIATPKMQIFDYNSEKQGPHKTTCSSLPLNKVDKSTKNHCNISNGTFQNNLPVIPKKQNYIDENSLKISDSLRDQNKKVNFLQPNPQASECVQIEENVELSDEHNPLKVAPIKPMNLKVSPVENTNFSCLLQNERCSKANFTCAPLCSVINKVSSNVKQPSSYKTAQSIGDVSSKQCRKSATSFSISDISVENHNVATSNSRDNFLSNFAINSIPETCNRTDNYLVISKPNDIVSASHSDYMNLNFGKSNSSQVGSTIQSNKPPPPNPPLLDDINYSNVHLGKPYCPTPNPISAKLDTSATTLEGGVASLSVTSPQIAVAVNNTCGGNHPVSKTVLPKAAYPHTLPAFRKQMSAPAVPSSLKVDLPSPGRKSSCPVTASVSMIKPPLSVSSHSPKPAPLQSFGASSGHLRVSSRSPDHSSVSSISSASDELSSSHSSPKLASGILNRPEASDCVYENVAIPQRASNSRPSSVSSEKELNYASLDLAPASKNEVPRSPSTCKPSAAANTSDPLLYAEIDFTKSEGLKNTSGTLREARL